MLSSDSKCRLGTGYSSRLGWELSFFFSGVGYLFPRPPSLDPFYYWTRGWAMVLALIGLACLVVALLWTAAVLVYYAVIPPGVSV